MPLSEFSGVILSNDGVRATGTVAPARNAQGAAVPRTTPVHVHFLVVQDGGRWVSGRAETMGSAWAGMATEGPGVQLGPAQGIGVAVTPRTEPPVAFETFTWFEEVAVTA
jgi:hypothetical protein